MFGKFPKKSPSNSEIKLGIIGGTGIYNLEGLSDVSLQEINTPFGTTSSPVICGVVENTEVFFISRHGLAHSLIPSEVNAQANIYALKLLGAEWVISVGAVESLRQFRKIGDLVIPHQVIDRTTGRKGTFFGSGICAHVAFDQPFCPILRQVLNESIGRIKNSNNLEVHDKGIYCCVDGPTSSTKSECELYRNWGCDLIGMTAMPEARLAREAEMSYAVLALVTDIDSGLDEDNPLEPAELMDLLKNRVDQTKSILVNCARSLYGVEAPHFVKNALEGSILTNLSNIPKATFDNLAPIISKYY
jgi:5'-methylthioadenosine phosphorylase